MLTRLKSIGPVAYFFIGMLSTAVGLLPWIITGMRLPIQNLWAVETSAADMPVSLLPFSQYQLSTIAAIIVIGSTLAGGAARATRKQHPKFAVTAVVLGVLTVQVAAIIQSAVTVSDGLGERREATVYLVALTAGAAASAVLGVGMLLLIAKAPRPGATIALSIAAVALGSWLSALVAPMGTFPTETTMAVLGLLRWVPAIVVGLAIAWCGVTSVGRVIAAISSLLILWIGPTLVTAVSAAAGTRMLAAYPPRCWTTECRSSSPRSA
jgi:hypothetical protein